VVGGSWPTIEDDPGARVTARSGPELGATTARITIAGIMSGRGWHTIFGSKVCCVLVPIAPFP
jgi:hypothetical protein